MQWLSSHFSLLRLLAPDRSALIGEFGGDTKEDRRCSEATNAPPASNVPAPGAQVGAKRAADEVAEHVNHVESTPGTRVDAVDAGLVGNVTALHAQIHQDDSDNQAGEVLAGKAQEEE
jgi:hypothetical protein